MPDEALVTIAIVLSSCAYTWWPSSVRGIYDDHHV